MKTLDMRELPARRVGTQKEIIESIAPGVLGMTSFSWDITFVSVPVERGGWEEV